MSRRASRAPGVLPIDSAAAAAARASAWLREIPLCDREEFEREVLHLIRERFHAAREVVVEIDGGYRREQSHRGRDERFRDSRRHDAETRRARARDRLE